MSEVVVLAGLILNALLVAAVRPELVACRV